MNKSRSAAVMWSRLERDEALRTAHQRAFAKISEACTTVDFHGTVAEAVSELVDACEAYADAR